jgi:hypothetical protein
MKKRGPPPRPPTSLRAAIKGLAIGHGLKTLIGVQPQPLPLSNMIKVTQIPRFNKTFVDPKLLRNFRNYRGLNKISHTNSKKKQMINLLNTQQKMTPYYYPLNKLIIDTSKYK